MSFNKELEDEKSFKHWATIISEEAIKKFGDKQTVATGWSPSGYYHIGNFREGVSCRAIVHELENLGSSVRFILNVDDLDPFDKIPSFFRKDYEKILYSRLGEPINQVPDPLGCHNSYAEHFFDNAFENMHLFDVNPEPVLTSRSYAEGYYDSYIIHYLKNREEIYSLTEEITGSRMEDFILVQCPSCKKMNTTKVTDFKIKGDTVYVNLICSSVKGGCGHQEQIKLGKTTWKLKWRLDWAARQDFLKVTVEPAGKDHGVAGGSIDTSIAIHKRIFKHEPPLMPTYGFITFGGKKLSGSAGTGIPVSEFPKILEPETFLYKIYRLTLRRDFDFNVTMDVPNIAAEFDRAEEVYFQELSKGHKKTIEKDLKAYELAFIGPIPEKKPVRVNYGQLAVIMQVYLFKEDLVIDKLKKQGIIPSDITEEDMRRLKSRFERVKYWLQHYADERLKFRILDIPYCEQVKKVNRNLCDTLVNAIKTINEAVSADEITQQLYEYAKRNGVKPKEFFKALYIILLGKTYGPRAGTIVKVIGKEEIKLKLEKALECY